MIKRIFKKLFPDFVIPYLACIGRYQVCRSQVYWQDGIPYINTGVEELQPVLLYDIPCTYGIRQWFAAQHRKNTLTEWTKL